jgi:hypothetical protein
MEVANAIAPRGACPCRRDRAHRTPNNNANNRRHEQSTMLMSRKQPNRLPADGLNGGNAATPGGDDQRQGRGGFGDHRNKPTIIILTI